jgi:tetratricopeptide (TPR) repeat protein
MTLPASHRSIRALSALVLAFSLVTVGIVPTPAYATRDNPTEDQQDRKDKRQRDSREMQAREAYAAGNYKEALDIYTKLYAEKLHPTYLRNIGRCYQNLNDPDRAISSFREYLRKAKDMPADERNEVEGYIQEMENLQKQNAAAAEAAKPAPQPLPVVAQPQPVQPAFVVEQPAPAPEPVPFYKKGWFWGVAGAVVVAGVVTGLAVGGVFSSKSRCPAGFTCSGN